MTRRSGVAVLVFVACSGLAWGDTDPSQTPPNAIKKKPANAQNVVPITEFMEQPEFPFAPKPKPSLWSRFFKAMKRPFAAEAVMDELPPGTVPTPGMLPTVGPRPAALPMKR